MNRYIFGLVHRTGRLRQSVSVVKVTDNTITAVAFIPPTRYLDMFNVGDVVALRSSHIRMTVVNVNLSGAPDACDCVWFDEQKALHSARFPFAALVNLSNSLPNPYPLDKP